MPFYKRSCKEVAALVVAREDRDLRWDERLQLRAHMFICETCPNFEGQILTMRHAMRRWRNYTVDTSQEQSPTDTKRP